MTEPTDIDALRDRAGEKGLSLPALDYIHALEAELRQERERADEASHAAGRHKSDAAYWENEYETAEDMKAELRADLSRAEETIEKVRYSRKRIEESFDAGSPWDHCMESFVSEVDHILTTYDQQS